MAYPRQMFHVEHRSFDADLGQSRRHLRTGHQYLRRTVDEHPKQAALVVPIQFRAQIVHLQDRPVPEQIRKMPGLAEQQRERTMIAATAAEKQREQEQKAKAAADNAYRNAMAMSPEQFIQLEYIRRMSEACSKSTCVIGQPGIALSIK